MKVKLVFDWTDDEGEQNDEVCRISLVIDSATFQVIEANHDDHGWDGMVGIIDALHKVAEAGSWDVEVIGESGV